jgi:hypothetical protein
MAGLLFAYEPKIARSSMQTPRVSTEQPRESPKQKNSFKNVVQVVSKALKQHHQSVNSAFDSVYGTTFYSRRSSTNSERRSS